MEDTNRVADWSCSIRETAGELIRDCQRILSTGPFPSRQNCRIWSETDRDEVPFVNQSEPKRVCSQTRLGSSPKALRVLVYEGIISDIRRVFAQFSSELDEFPCETSLVFFSLVPEEYWRLKRHVVSQTFHTHFQRKCEKYIMKRLQEERERITKFYNIIAGIIRYS